MSEKKKTINCPSCGTEINVEECVLKRTAILKVRHN
jgi:transcription elongation factor Elf1